MVYWGAAAQLVSPTRFILLQFFHAFGRADDLGREIGHDIPGIAAAWNRPIFGPSLLRQEGDIGPSVAIGWGWQVKKHLRHRAAKGGHREVA